jgi:uncharacterized protein
MVTATSQTFPEDECAQARLTAEAQGFRHHEIETDEMADDLFLANTQNRCYYCKTQLFQKLNGIARKEGLQWIVDASNYDDLKDYRPGRRAAAEMGIRSPLCEAELTKKEIRELSRQRGLQTWDKPSMACLASRIPYHTPITQEALRKVASAEAYLKSLGVMQVRVRHHGDTARIEVDDTDMPIFLDTCKRKEIVEKLKALGYTYVALDLAGYRSGSLNETLGATPARE